MKEVVTEETEAGHFPSVYPQSGELVVDGTDLLRYGIIILFFI
ncbi:hypothetical protein ACFLT8_06785 [Chloroflexota bacterium]